MSNSFRNRRDLQGFSLVEMMVALVFTMVLMAGMAVVFKSSLSTFVTANEKVSAARRGRMGNDLIYQDLNNMGMYLKSLTGYPTTLSSSNPGFFVVPNVSYAASGLDPQVGYPNNWPYPVSTGDQLYLYYDDPLPYNATIGSDIVGQAVMEDAKTVVNDSSLYTIQFGDTSQPKLVHKGMQIVFRDSWDVREISQEPQINTDPTSITVTTTGQSIAGGYDDASGAPTGLTPLSKTGHLSGRQVLVLNPAQQVRYSIQTRALDPSNTALLIPCLVREQGSYGGAFDSTQTVVVAENVVGFKVYVSVDKGVTWAGSGLTTVGASGDSTCWNDLSGSGQYRKVLNDYLTSNGRTGYKDTSNLNWFREIPVMVRVDLLTRTMNKRGEYGNQGPSPTLDYGTQLQSLVIVPRHSGLPLG